MKKIILFSFLILNLFLKFSFVSAVDVSAQVPDNAYSKLAEQLLEKEKYLQEKFLEIESLREKLFWLLFFGLLFLYLLAFLIFYFNYRWKKNIYSLIKNSAKEKKYFKENISKTLPKNLKPLTIFKLQKVICPFFQNPNGGCQLEKLTKEITEFIKKAPLNEKTKPMIIGLEKGIGTFGEKCLKKADFEKIKFCKLKIDNIRHNLNRLKRKGELDISLKKELGKIREKTFKIGFKFFSFLKSVT